MNLWGVQFRTVRPMPGFPVVLNVCSETQFGAGYRLLGKNRVKETHSIYKYTLEGVGGFSDGSGEHRLPAGVGFLTEIGDAETAYYYPPECAEPWTFVYIAFRGAPATRMVRDLVKRHGHIYAMPSDEGIIRRLRNLRKEEKAVSVVSAASGAQLVFDTLLALGASKEREQTVWSEEHPLVRRFERAVTDTIDRSVDVCEMARAVGVSREHLTRVFREQTGMTPYAYLVRRKMLHACRLLKNTSLSAKEISGMLGYGYQAHFSRTFKRLLGMTPRAFREVGRIPLRAEELLGGRE